MFINNPLCFNRNLSEECSNEEYSERRERKGKITFDP